MHGMEFITLMVWTLMVLGKAFGEGLRNTFQ
jgi:hypothetical protein